MVIMERDSPNYAPQQKLVIASLASVLLSGYVEPA